MVKSTLEKYRELMSPGAYIETPKHEDEEAVAEAEAEAAAQAFLGKYRKTPNFRRRIAGKIAHELFLKDRSAPKASSQDLLDSAGDFE